MSAVFQPDFVVAEDSTLVALKYISEFSYKPEDDMEHTKDLLAGDPCIFVTVVHGKKYKISMLRQIDIFSGKFKISTDVDELRLSIYEKWLNFIK